MGNPDEDQRNQERHRQRPDEAAPEPEERVDVGPGNPKIDEPPDTTMAAPAIM